MPGDPDPDPTADDEEQDHAVVIDHDREAAEDEAALDIIEAAAEHIAIIDETEEADPTAGDGHTGPPAGREGDLELGRNRNPLHHPRYTGSSQKPRRTNTGFIGTWPTT